MFDKKAPVGETYFGSNFIARITERLTIAKYTLNQKVFECFLVKNRPLGT